MSYQSTNPMEAPRTKPSLPPCNDLPGLNLPPSLPKQSFIADPNGDFPQEQPMGRSLTNNNHGSFIPAGSLNNNNNNNGGIKMGQSPTIFSMLSGTGEMSYRGQATSMVASSRVHVSSDQYQQQQGLFQQQPPQPQMYNNAVQYAPPQIQANNDMGDVDEDDEFAFDGYTNDANLPFEFDQQ